MALADEIEAIRIGLKTGSFANEASVSQGIVMRLLNSLGWPVYDTKIVSPEYSLEGRRVDYALCHPAAKPVAFIEVKQLGKSDGAERQLFEYAFHKGVQLAILTDGQEWNFFLPAEQGDYGDRRVYKLDLLERGASESEYRLDRYLGYKGIASGNAIEFARADYRNVARERQMRDTLPQAWSQLIEEEDDLLLELIADRVERLCGYKPDLDTVAAFLKQRLITKLSAAPAPATTSTPSLSSSPKVAPTAQAVGQIGFTFHGRFRPARNACDVLINVLETFAQADAGFLDRFDGLPKHGRIRRYIARDPDALYPGRADLGSGLTT